MPRVSSVTALILTLVLVALASSQGLGQGPGDDASKVRTGLEIAPVPLDLKGKNKALVGLGSYIVNAQADCGGCHSTPLYAEGGDPHLGQPEEISQDTYLSGGGELFGPFVPRNLTPNASGEPAGLSLDEFIETMRTGRDLKNRPPQVPSAGNDLLQVMPWPIFAKMSDRELHAIYEYLSAIPCLPSSTNPTRCD
jgi:hypothetical protein